MKTYFDGSFADLQIDSDYRLALLVEQGQQARLQDPFDGGHQLAHNRIYSAHVKLHLQIIVLQPVAFGWAISQLVTGGPLDFPVLSGGLLQIGRLLTGYKNS